MDEVTPFDSRQKVRLAMMIFDEPAFTAKTTTNPSQE